MGSLLIAALDLRPKCAGEACLPVARVLPQLKQEERDFDGIVHASPAFGIDLLNEGLKIGRLYMTFETKQLPSSSWSFGCCGPCKTDDNEAPCNTCKSKQPVEDDAEST